MGLLAPLYLAGLAALSLPVVLHLVRRTPRGRQVFSSLMFLSPTPPRLTSRSRLDQILLLLLRLAALAVLAAAFMRPFLRETATLAMDQAPSRRVALLLDVSASMRRGDLWSQAVQQAEKELAKLAPADDVALFTFGDRLNRIVEFENAATLSSGTAKPEIIRKALLELKPGWDGSRMAGAVVALAAELDSAADVGQSATEPSIVLISDFQKGSTLTEFQGYEWPQRVQLDCRAIEPAQRSNAHLQLLKPDLEARDDVPRVRIANSADSKIDQVFLRWSLGPAPASPADEMPGYVPAGESRVMKLPRPESLAQADRIVLRGDEAEFDNSWYVVPPRKEQLQLAYAGGDAATDPQGIQYFLKLAVSGDTLRQIEIQPLEASAASLPKLIVASTRLDADRLAAVTEAVEKGSTLLVVPTDNESAGLITQLFEGVSVSDPTTDAEMEAGKFSLLGEIDFAHPLFLPFANPRYSDFTRIHFWRRWPLKLADDAQAVVIARFDDRAPALIEKKYGSGRILALAANWRPDDSQLALSSKFVPLIGALINLAYGQSAALPGVTANDSITLPPEFAEAQVIVHPPEGEDITLETGATAFDQTIQPGIYAFQSGTNSLQVAVNLAATESETEPMDLGDLKRLGVRTDPKPSRETQLAAIRQQRDVELEGQQKLWRWLIVAALAILFVETALAARAQRTLRRPMEAAS